MPLVECVPNFSEGRDLTIVAAIRDAIAAHDGVHVLDVTSDASHNRSVITFVASLESAVPAALAAMRVARDRIDLTQQSGEHPRIGATDVVPFIPLDGATMDDCVALARALGERAHRELGIPVYLYERAATTPSRVNLADVRRGQFEGLRDEIRTNPARRPDFGQTELHPTAGATAVGARPFLVAYNIYLGDKANMPVAKAVAKAVRFSSGGLPYVKALAMEVDGQAQVSMNLVDTEQTPLHVVYDAVRAEAAKHGVEPTWSELIGLMPQRVLLEAGAHAIKLRGYNEGMLLEQRLHDAMHDQSVDGFLGSVAAATPTPGGGSAAAHVAALGAALTQMVAGLTAGRQKHADVHDEMQRIVTDAHALRSKLTALVQRDAASFEGVQLAYRLPLGSDEQQAARATAIREALIHAAEVPLETARTAVEVAALAASVAERGNRNAVGDACVAALLAETACRATMLNVRLNVSSLDDAGTERGAELASEARSLLDAASMHARIAEAEAERSIRLP
jgi:glutamate formiminotransferase/formiminotetrahydrofolate cyclodeaminase